MPQPRAILAFLLPLILLAASAAATTVALVSSDPAAQNSLAILQTQLSSEKSLQFVERSAISKVLDEQKLTAFTDPNHAVTLGHLLHADLFAIIEFAPDSKNSSPLGLVIYDSVTGVRLVDLALPQDHPESHAPAVSSALFAAMQKRSAPAADQKTLCLVAVRNTNLPRDRDSFCDALGLLLQRSLISSPNLLLLERQRLEFLTKERQLPTATAPADPFLTSLITIDLDLTRSPDGASLTGTILLTDAAGKVLAKPTATVPILDAATLPRSLASEIATAIRITASPAIPDLKLEARRFAAEAEFLHAHSQEDASLRAAEAAYALDPARLQHEMLLINALLRSAERMVEIPREQKPVGSNQMFRSNPDLAGAFAQAARALDMRIESLRRDPDHNASTQYGDSEACRSIHYFLGLEKQADHPVFNAVVTEASRAYRDRYLQMFKLNIDQVHQKIDSSVTGIWALEGALGYFGDGLLVGMRLTADSPDQYYAQVIELATLFLDKVPAAVATNKGMTQLEKVVEAIRWTQAPTQPHMMKKLDDKSRALLDAFYEKVENSSIIGAPVLAIRARLDLAYAPDFVKDHRIAQFKCAVELVDKSLDDPAVHPAVIGHHRLILYKELCEIVFRGNNGPFPDPAQELPICDQCAQIMLHRHELNPDLLESILYRYSGAAQAKTIPASSQKAVADLAALFDAPDTTFPGTTRNRVNEVMANLRSIGTLTALNSVPPLKLTLKALLTPPENIGKTIVDTVKDTAFVVTELGSENKQKYTLQAFAVPLSGIKPIPLATITVSSTTDHFYFLNDIALDGQNIYLATGGAGVVIFPRDGSPAQQLTTTDGLPSNKTQCVASLEGKLYVGYSSISPPDGESGYLASYDLKTRQTALVASSRRKEKLSPFDDSLSFNVHSLTADPKHHRLLADITHNNEKYLEDPLSGLSQYKPADNSFKVLVRTDSQTYAEWTDKPAPDAPLLFGSVFAIFYFDRQTDQCNTLFNVFDESVISGRRKTDKPKFVSRPSAAPCALINGELWAGDHLIRLIPPNNQRQRILPFSDDLQRTNYIQTIHDNKDLLIGTESGIWITPTPPPYAPPAK